MKNDELMKLKAELVLHAIEIGKNFEIELDFSERSVHDVEHILAQIHEDYKKTQNEEGLFGLAIEFGLYLIEVIEKNRASGRLEKDHKDFGENVFPFYWENGTLFPVAWCDKRIFNGPDDDVWMKYKLTVIDKVQNN